MTKKLESALTRIRSAKGNHVGVGCLVSDKHIVTCAHVILDALGISRTTNEQPKTSVQLDFAFEFSQQVFNAKIIFWRPVHFNQATLSEFGEDIALLELDKPVLSAKPACFLLTNPSDLEQHPFQVFGMPKGNPQGVWADGIVIKGLANGWVQIEDKEQSGFQVEPGFSGSPVWDTYLDAVIGMIVATDPNRIEARVGFMIPTLELFKACPLLEDIKAINRKKLEITQSERKVVAQLLTFLEDRRLLTESLGYQFHYPDHLRKSAQEIRKRVNLALQEIERDSKLAPILKQFQFATRSFQEETEKALQHPGLGFHLYAGYLEEHQFYMTISIIAAAELCSLEVDRGILEAFERGKNRVRGY